MSDHRVLDALAGRLGAPLGLASLKDVHAEIDSLGAWDGSRAGAPAVAHPEPPVVAEGQAVLATWHLLLDSGRCQEREQFLAGTAQRPVARVAEAFASRLGVVTGEPVTVSTEHGAISLPVVVTAMPDGVVWLPVSSPGSGVRSTLRVDAGAVVAVAAGGPEGSDLAQDLAQDLEKDGAQ
jgi:NADH-quinone oxidoreductase subunit G